MNDVLAFAHIGDTHLTRAAERNFVDLLAIAAQIELECASRLDFVVLPGDIADHGLPSQYRLARTALKMLSLPVHAIPGDHDREPGSLAAFHAELAPDPLPKSILVNGCRCLFLDSSGPGQGGPDFRLGEAQLGWLETELNSAGRLSEPALLFMHVYPADLKGEGETERLNRLLDEHRVALVDMGHTHYNELGVEGHTVFAATRSTGQVEEGPVGYSLITYDRGVVGWRFKLLDDPFPCVAIVSPADRRLVRDPGQTLGEGARCEVRAIVFGAEAIASVACRFEGQSWSPMQREGRVWTGRVETPRSPLAGLTVRAETADGRPGQHTIVPAVGALDPSGRTREGSDAASIGAWPENGIFGTQLGPNRNGRHW